VATTTVTIRQWQRDNNVGENATAKKTATRRWRREDNVEETATAARR
jgi:hypothetical protein